MKRSHQDAFGIQPQDIQDKIEKHFKGSPLTNPHTLKAHIILGNNFFDQCCFQEAMCEYQQEINENPNSIEAFINLCAVLEEDNKLEECIQILNDAIEKNPESHDLFIYLGLLSYKRSKVSEASEAFDRASQLIIQNNVDIRTIIQQNKKNYLIIQPDMQQSLGYYRLGIHLNKMEVIEEAILILSQKSQPESGALFVLGLAYLKKEDTLNAISCLEKAKEINSEEERVYFYLGNAFYQQGNFDQAIENYSLAAKLNPQNVDNFYNLGNIYFEQGNYKEAVVNYQKVIDQNPTDSSTLNHLGLANYELDNIEEAARCYNQAIEVNPHEAFAFSNLGLLYYDQKNYEEAIKCFSEAVQLEMNEAFLYNNLGTAYQAIQKYDEAVTAYETAIKLSPSFEKAYHNLACVYCDQKRYQEAVDASTMAIELAPQDPLSYCVRAEALSKLSFEEKALDNLKKANELFQNNGLQRQFSDENLGFINFALVEGKQELLKKLAEVQKLSVETSKIASGLDQTQANVQIEVERFNLLRVDTSRLFGDVVGNLRNESNKIQDLKEETITALMTRMQKLEEMLLQSQNQLQKMTVEVVFLKENQRTIQNVLKMARVYDKASVRENFVKLRQENRELFEYAHTFCWSLFHYIKSYQLLKTNLMNGNTSIDKDSSDDAIKKALEMSTTIVKDIVGTVPILGTAVSILDEFVDINLFENMQESKFEKKVDIINQVIMSTKDEEKIILTEEDLSFVCANTAFLILNAKKEEILRACIPVTELKGYFQRIIECVKEKFLCLKRKMFPAVEEENSPASDLALEDLSALLSGIFESCEEILKSNKPLEEQFSEIVIRKRWSN